MTLRALIILLLGAGVAAAQNAEVPITATAVVPAVSSIAGWGGIHWKADVVLVNDTGTAVDVGLELTSIPGAAILLPLEPGQVQRFTDLIGQAFGLDGVLSPLRVITGGRRSVTVTTSIYAVNDGDVSPLQQVPAAYGSTYFPTRTLDGLAFSDDERTNVGLVNLSDEEADFLLAVQRIPGRNVAVRHVRVPPQSVHQDAIQALFPMITKGTGFTVVVESPSTETIVYASVISNTNHEARYIAPRLGN
jgi:hypothetical protein